MTRKGIVIGVIIVVALALIGWYYFNSKQGEEISNPITSTVMKGPFRINVSATGELKAKNSVKIMGPSGMRSAGIWQTTIQSIQPEGTLVKKGQVVATLDKSSIQSKIDEVNTEIEKVETQLEQAKIDTAISLSTMRDQLSDLEFTMEEKKLVVQQSQFEPEMIIHQAQLDLKRAERDFVQLKENYRLKQQQARAKISEKNTVLKQQKNKLNLFLKLSDEFQIKAPEDGMLIYMSSWNGEKSGVGSQVSAWNPEVAELPDLTQMISIIYVNEVDISKVKPGHSVDVSIDAFPDKQFAGKVVKIANIGQQLRNQDAKVFEVIVELEGQDPTLRPAMTTGNNILTREYADRLYIPLECLHQDSVTYVYVERKGKVVRQELMLGASNENHIMVHLGLEEGETVFLQYDEGKSPPSFVYLNKEEKEKIDGQIAAEEETHQKYLAELAASVKPLQNTPGSASRSRIIIR